MEEELIYYPAGNFKISICRDKEAEYISKEYDADKHCLEDFCRAIAKMARQYKDAVSDEIHDCAFFICNRKKVVYVCFLKGEYDISIYDTHTRTFSNALNAEEAKELLAYAGVFAFRCENSLTSHSRLIYNLEVSQEYVKQQFNPLSNQIRAGPNYSM